VQDGGREWAGSQLATRTFDYADAGGQGCDHNTQRLSLMRNSALILAWVMGAWAQATKEGGHVVPRKPGRAFLCSKLPVAAASESCIS
jgi:hypothetical protein